MTHKCNIKLEINVYTDCKTPDELLRLYCLPETIAQAICDEVTDDKTVVDYDVQYDITDV